MEKVLVAGATGATGKKVVSILKNSDIYEPVALVRNDEQKQYFESKGIETVMGDLTQNLSHTTKGIDKVVFAAGSKGKDLHNVDQEGAKRLIDASKKERIKKFVMLSAMGVDHPEIYPDLQNYLKAKQNADEYLDISGLTFSIVRPGTLTDDDGFGRIEVKKEFSESGKIPRWDVARTLVKSLETEAAKNQAFEVITGNTEISEAVDSFQVLA